MQAALASLNERLKPAEEIFFAWLLRVVVAATLVGTSWIDDAPPLELGALIIALYVAARVATQFGPLMSAAPFQSGALRGAFAVLCVAVLALAFMTVVTFTETLALHAVGR